MATGNRRGRIRKARRLGPALDPLPRQPFRTLSCSSIRSSDNAAVVEGLWMLLPSPPLADTQCVARLCSATTTAKRLLPAASRCNER